MLRLIVLVEGQTEENFVNKVLLPHLILHGYISVSAKLMGKHRNRASRGGIREWNTVKREIKNFILNDQEMLITTFADYYGLPLSEGGWPGRAESEQLPFQEKAKHIENSLFCDLQREIPNIHLDKKFIPFVMMHEFESILFSDCAQFSSSIGRPCIGEAMQSIRNQYASPEEINDSRETTPSKRLHKIFIDTLGDGYDKILYGTLGASEIGLDQIRRECQHFNEWLNKLEAASIRTT